MEAANCSRGGAIGTCTAAGSGTCILTVRSSGRRLQSCFTGLGVSFPGRSHWPDLLQQGWCLPGNMKYCSQDTHPPQRNVATTTSESSELAILRSTLVFIMQQTATGALANGAAKLRCGHESAFPDFIRVSERIVGQVEP